MAFGSYPKIPESNWWKLRDQFKKTLPGAVTPAYVRSLLGLNSEKAAQNLIGPLRQLGLIDEDNKPTARANDWRNDGKYADVCREMLAEIYPQELRDLYGGADLDRHAVEDWFSHVAALGQGAAAKNAQMYVLLNEGVPRSLEGPPKKGEVKPKSGKSVAGDKGDQASRKSSGTPQVQQKRDGGSSKPAVAPTVHMDFQIHISPEAGAEQIEAIFAAMAKHLYDKQ